jgi:putative transcriptional regulator
MMLLSRQQSKKETGKKSNMTTRKKTYRSDALRSLHLAAEDLHAVGAIDKLTMRRFDVACLTPVEGLQPEKIKRIRESAHMSQALFARALNVTTSLVSKWERGEKKPSGPSLKLLALADKKGIEAIL